MNNRFVAIDDTDDIRWITINRPKKVNALTAVMMHQLAAAIEEATRAKLIVIKATGDKGFCAGADIAEFAREGKGLEGQNSGLIRVSTALLTAHCAVIAAVHGRTLGAGVLIAALCDLVIASENLELGTPEIQFNMYPTIVHAALEAKVSEAIAYQLCVTGRMLSATEARTVGLVSGVVPNDNFVAYVDESVNFYHKRIEALEIGRRTKRKAEEVLARIKNVAPLLQENFRQPGVRNTMLNYIGKN